MHSSEPAMIRLYLTLVRPVLEYGAEVWHPHLIKDTQALENVQKFMEVFCGQKSINCNRIYPKVCKRVFAIDFVSNRVFAIDLSSSSSYCNRVIAIEFLQSIIVHRRVFAIEFLQSILVRRRVFAIDLSSSSSFCK